MDKPSGTVAMVFAGGLGLAAYHAGVFQRFASRSLPLHWVAGSSAGAVTAALIAGNPAASRIDRLRAFWNCPPVESYASAPFRHLSAWMGAVRTRLIGSPGHFHPRIPSLNSFSFRSLYDLEPMRERLTALIDFDRLNGGEIRVCVAATDIETGDPVIFDSRKHRIHVDHLMASCGFLPEFAPMQVDGRLLGDGGLSLNAPFDPILESDTADGDLLLYVVDLYARDGDRPDTFEAASERKTDLIYGNQTYIRLKYCLELSRLRNKLNGGGGGARRKAYLLSYRPGREEPGPEKSFELSPSALAQRWNAGVLDMEYSEHVHPQGELVLVRRKSARAKAA
jgi:NTE family protein